MSAAEDTLEQEVPRGRSRLPRVLRWAGFALLGILAVFFLLIAFLHTPPGRQFIVDQISKFAPASGLSVEVGSIDGSVLWSSTFEDVELRDANQTLFLTAPRIDLNWRPWKWFFTGLDVRHLAVSDGTLYAIPELLPGDPDAPFLPDFDIRVDRFVIEDLTVAEGILGEERIIQFRSEADIRSGRVLLDANGAFGGGDQFSVLVEAEPDGDIFDLDLDWRAPAGGFLAAMAGAQEDLSVALSGDGSWSSWQGELLAVQGGEDLLDFDIYNEGGQYRMVGQAFPGAYVDGLAARALGEAVAFTASGTLEDSTLEGSFALRGQALDLDASGAVDLAGNRFEDMQLASELLDPTLFGADIELENARLRARLDGPFSDITVPHELAIGSINAGGVVFTEFAQSGTLIFGDDQITVPLDAQLARITSGNQMFDPRLVNGQVGGTLTYSGSRLTSDNLAIRFPGVDARLGLLANFENGRARLTGPVNASDFAFEGIGILDVRADVDFTIGGGAPWAVTAALDGRVDQLTNSVIGTIAGEDIAFTTDISVGGAQPLSFADAVITASKLDLAGDGRIEGEDTLFAGSGTHADYGPFTVDARLAADGPYAQLVLESPLPAADLKDVHVALAPSEQGFAIETSGGSLLGPFSGLLDIVLAENGDTSIGVRRLDIAESRVSGNLALVEGGVSGGLDMSRGGVDGEIALAVRDGGQGFDIDLTARDARFGWDTPLILARADMDISGVFGGDATTVEGEMTAQGVSWGNLFVGRMAADAQLRDGQGTFNAALAGRRGSRFELMLNGEATTERIGLAAQGSYAGQDISMPRRAVLQKTADGGWQLQRTQLGYGRGVAVAYGRFGGDEAAQGRLSMSNMPIALIDAVSGDLGLGGTISGVVDLATNEDGLPVGEARLMVDGLTRSGLLMTSRPLDMAAVVSLSPDLMQARAVMEDDSGANGRVNARVANLPQTGGLWPRLYAGDLFAQLRYDGPSEALWRLAALDLLDVTGDMQLSANARGTLENPQVRGSLQGDSLHIQSALTGSDISGVEARGRFDGSRLQLTSFAGTAPGGGRVNGSGFIDLSGMSRDRGPQIDIRLAARDARILQLPGMGATVTGPLRIISNGVGGTIAGRLQVREAEWRLGTADEAVELPDIAITEINLPVDIAPPGRAARPWRYLIDVSASRGIKVDGMGLDSEWSGDINLRGTTADPRIGGEVRIVPRQGFYSFAGVRFEITRGRIDFDENAAPDPRLDLLAEADVNGLDVDVEVRGRASQPQVSFASVPALPEEELLARILFGGSVTELSATDALQLGAALASMRGGGGMDPINQLRSAIGLDRLRIVPSDPALARGTSVAMGKNISRRLYAELITDGQGYNATELEFRVTGWLSLLGSISTVGRGSVAAEISRDY